MDRYDDIVGDGPGGSPVEEREYVRHYIDIALVPDDVGDDDDERTNADDERGGSPLGIIPVFFPVPAFLRRRLV